MKKKLFSWHRNISMIIAIPVILWAASGFMHPLMTTIRPRIATQQLQPVVIDSSKIKVSLQAALQKNYIDSIAGFRLVHIDTNWFYQVQRAYEKEPVYLATLTGKKLVAGDWLYAQYLAREFLEGTTFAVKPSGHTASGHNILQTAQESTDCCDAAAACVLNVTKGSKVANVSLVTSFNSEYKSINRLLPVYNVSFEREDGIRVYVQTTQDRFAFAMDDKRRIFDRIFTILHTWGWLDFLGKGRDMIVFLFSFLSFVTAVFGVYIFFTTKSRKVTGNPVIIARRKHRYTSISIALFTLMFTFSGAFHALSKFREDVRGKYAMQPYYQVTDINFDFNNLQNTIQDKITNLSLVKIDENSYWRVVIQNHGNTDRGQKDLMKGNSFVNGQIIYVSCTSGKSLKDGERIYALYLASKLSGLPQNEIVSVTPVSSFTNEYNFADKILPVWRIAYKYNGNRRFYVETATGKLSKSINDNDLIEGYSFAFFHKHEFMAWGGKSLKDFSTMFWAMAQIAMVVVGLALYFSKKRKKVL